MLKALELSGFKSFADKTRFDFPAGITVVVGPNGSGKSNIVDGIKWVLGEQSAKSLRGKEMSDVIFKGSDIGGRKPLNTAEATLVFDNSDKRLPFDAPEVHITRRVYRSGEGEYLINRQPARMKDIRDLFRGSGVGADAYSIIEQGRVEKLLQASPKDRRAIFEEAAGISRFKAKKVEAQRRLERVDQNLLRLRDIVEEVESRLKSIRNQAAKAKRYREYSQRLQQLRTQVAQVDWRRLSERLSTLEAEAEEHRSRAASSVAEADRLDAQLLAIDTETIAREEQVRLCDAHMSRARQEIAERAATNELERNRWTELEQEESQLRHAGLALSDRAGDVKQRLRDTQQELAEAERVHKHLEQRVAEQESRLAEIVAQQQMLRQEGDQRRQEYVAQMQAAAVLASQLEAHLSQLAAVEQQRATLQQQHDALVVVAQTLADEHAALNQREAELARTAVERQNELELVQRDLVEQRNLFASRQDDLSQLSGRRRGVAERTAVLEELERTFEGLGVGVKELIVRAKAANDGPLASIRGMVADFVHAPVEYAAATDAALGDAAQHLVVDQPLKEIATLAAEVGAMSGRATFVSTAPTVVAGAMSANEAASEALLASDRATIGPLTSVLQIEPAQAEIAQRLLGSVWLVRSLSDALRLCEHLPIGGRIVTVTGELVEAFGAVAIGPRQAATNLVSRRSELRATKNELAVLDTQIASAQRETQHLRGTIQKLETTAAGIVEAARQIAEETTQLRLASHVCEERSRTNARQQESIEVALTESDCRGNSLNAAAEQCRLNLAKSESDVAGLQKTLRTDELNLAELDTQRQQAARDATARRVELAKGEQLVEALQLRCMQFEEDGRDRERAIQQTRQQADQNFRRRQTSQLTILNASMQAASLYLLKEELARERGELQEARDQANRQRSSFAAQVQKLRRSLRQLEEQQHQAELAAGQVRHERTTLAERMRDDYGIEVAALSEPAADEEQATAAVEEEIESLRRKLNQIGAVNLDALEELDELETRFAALDGQHRDLAEAKQALERIIHKINADSRRLFIETLEAIRVNFQALYRKAFGGGKADIVLEEGVDVLECGIEIVCTPPGKTQFNNSLLSGGEKALTAVALLLAIFQFRPSPFCILDEVDAPFDEANIGRFVDVLKDFLGWTKFVIVTHSKKTMTAATTLYGITMQESGVSKRVAVRFDDVTDDGHIRPDALQRQAVAESGAERGVA